VTLWAIHKYLILFFGHHDLIITCTTQRLKSLRFLALYQWIGLEQNLFQQGGYVNQGKNSHQFLSPIGIQENPQLNFHRNHMHV
jgi:hypothetical protein